MKRYALMGCLVVALLAMLTPAALATYTAATVSGYGPYQAGEGGEFTLQVNSDLAAILSSSYSSWTTDQAVPGSFGSFQTFCVETSEYIYPNTTYEVTLSDTTSFGGKTLTLGAAFLYYEFATGALADYDYDNDGVGRKTSAASLQQAIWFYMGLAADPNNAFTSLVASQIGTAAFDASNGAYGVEIMNLWVPGSVGLSGYARQDQLVLVPEPSSLLFLGFSLLMIAGIVSLKVRKTHA